MNARITKLSRSDYKIMPWKNGAGSTTELFIYPSDATVQSGFDWRISLAQVPASGPFSSFQDHQRTIMLLSGEPMRLVHKNHGEHKLMPFEPYDFHGSWETSGILTGGPVEDFNVMLRDGRGRCEVKVCRSQEKRLFQLGKSDFRWVWVWSGSARLGCSDQEYSLSERESILLEDGMESSLDLGSNDTVIITVSINLSSRC